jgi:ABC-type uncharacterized transport system ATPase subunit
LRKIKVCCNGWPAAILHEPKVVVLDEPMSDWTHWRRARDIILN